MNEIEMNENQLPPTSENTPDKSTKMEDITRKVKENWMKYSILIMVILTLLLGNIAISNGANSLKTAYEDTFKTEKEAAYQHQYKKSYDWAEKEYHTKNRATISIKDLKETANLEVLNVSDVEYIINSNTDTGNGIVSWLEVPGQGTYIVNLQAAEYIIDNEREYVLVRAPYPEMTNISIDYTNVKKLLFKNDVFTNEDFATGEDLARLQLNAADLLIKKEFASNQHFYLSAQDAAISTIQCLVKQLNPKLPNLAVDVEFY